ncbi:MAG: hypothetical protein CMD26_01495 [Flavobacteriales bacterium]|nr:hypothetical protein [Flavobacteriales bacterium]
MKYIIIIVFIPYILIGQLTVVNPGLEGPTGWGITPEPWQNCMPFGFFVPGYGDYATPDTQPGTFYVTLPPSEGSSYIGFGHITPYTSQPGLSEFQEGFGQELSSPMSANGCPYSFTIDLANGLTPDIWADPPPIETTIGEVKVFGGFDLCSEQELLWSSGPVTNEDWETYTVEFTPSDNYSHITFACFKADEDAECGYVLADNITPIINSAPTSNAGENQEICDDYTTLSANSLLDGETGMWSIISGNGDFTELNSPITEVNSLSPGENIFQWTVSAICTDEIGTSQVIITFEEEPFVDAGNNQLVCENYTTLNSNNTQNNETGFWSIISGGGIINNINDPNTIVSDLNEGENIFQWTISPILCEDVSDQVSINYINSTLISNAGQNTDVCENYFELNGNTPNYNETGYWNIITGTGVLEDPSNPNTIVNNLSIGSNTIEWIISDPCAAVSSYININFQNLEVTINDISNYNGYNLSCNNVYDGFISLSSLGGYPPYNYNWTGPNNFSSISEDISNLSPGEYECIITDGLQCQNIISIILEEPPEINLEFISFNDMDCFNNAYIDFNADGGTGTLQGLVTTSWGEVTSFIWNENDQWYFQYENFEQWDGLITVSAYDINGCEIISEEVLVQTWDDPIAEFETSTYNTEILQLVDFTDFSNYEASIINWYWDFDDGNMSNLQNPSHIYEQDGQYTVCLTIEDNNGCTSETCQIIHIYSNTEAYIPNIFTINQDDINEVFQPVINGFIEDSYEMLIYDRWGKLLFSTNDYQTGWDGTYQNNIVTQDVYSYRVTFLTITGESKEYIGKVSLVK